MERFTTSTSSSCQIILDLFLFFFFMSLPFCPEFIINRRRRRDSDFATEFASNKISTLSSDDRLGMGIISEEINVPPHQTRSSRAKHLRPEIEFSNIKRLIRSERCFIKQFPLIEDNFSSIIDLAALHFSKEQKNSNRQFNLSTYHYLA